MAIWDDVISARDRLVYGKTGRGTSRIGFGQRPALIIIDVNYNWVGDRRESILRSIERFPASCGEEAWRAVDHIAGLLPLARARKVPIFYTTNDFREDILWPGLSPGKGTGGRAALSRIERGTDIVDEIAPSPGDVVIAKPKPSAFFGTSLIGFLRTLGVDTLLCCGGTTSGCVRATVVDGYSYNYRVAVIEEATFDRAEVSHKINLFDMHAKYADVVPTAEVQKYLSRLPAPVVSVAAS
ncbi:MAG: isochorismatase family protein [Chloroflexi bacterium]|nr:isochorismatase family protein [Chloroflexota bacterium]